MKRKCDYLCRVTIFALILLSIFLASLGWKSKTSAKSLMAYPCFSTEIYVDEYLFIIETFQGVEDGTTFYLLSTNVEGLLNVPRQPIRMTGADQFRKVMDQIQQALKIDLRQKVDEIIERTERFIPPLTSV